MYALSMILLVTTIIALVTLLLTGIVLGRRKNFWGIYIAGIIGAICLLWYCASIAIHPVSYQNLDGYIDESYVIKGAVTLSGIVTNRPNNSEFYYVEAFVDNKSFNISTFSGRDNAFVITDSLEDPVLVLLNFTDLGNKFSGTEYSYLLYLSIEDYIPLANKKLSSKWKTVSESPIPTEVVNAFFEKPVLPIDNNQSSDIPDSGYYGLIESREVSSFKIDGEYYAFGFSDGTKKMYPMILVEIKETNKQSFLDTYRMKIPDENGTNVNIIYYIFHKGSS